MINYLKHLNKKLAPKHFAFGPEWIVLGVNNVCNLHCKMCDVGTQNLDSNFAQNLVGTSPLNMPIELIKKVIDQTANYYPNAKLGYAFTEPLVYPQLIESLAYAQEKNVYTTLTTNALTLRQKAVQLSEVGLNELFISLDGPQDIHNEIRGHNKSFQKAVDGIEALMATGNCPKITVICSITEWNIGHLKSLIESLKHLQIAEFAFMHTQFNSQISADKHNASKWGVHYPSSDSNVDKINFENMDFDALLEDIASIKAAHYPFKVYFSPEIEHKEELETYYLEPEKIIGKHCDAVFNSIMVKSDGSVIPAHGRCYNLTIGNVNDDHLKSIWASQTLKKLRGDLHEAGGLFQGCSRCCSAF